MVWSLVLLSTLLLVQEAVAQTPAAQGALLIQASIDSSLQLDRIQCIRYSPLLAMESVSRLPTATVPLLLSPIVTAALLNSSRLLMALSLPTEVPCVWCVLFHLPSEIWSSSVVYPFYQDVTNGTDADGTKLQLWTCYSGSVNQQWYYTGDNHLAWTNHAGCMVCHPL
jgi:hypothetical protein